MCAAYSWHANTIYTAHFRDTSALTNTQGVLASQWDAQITAAVPFFGLIFSFVAPLLLRRPIVVKEEESLTVEEIQEKQARQLAHIKMQNALDDEKRKGGFIAKRKKDLRLLIAKEQQQAQGTVPNLPIPVPVPIEPEIPATSEPEPVVLTQVQGEEDTTITEHIPVTPGEKEAQSPTNILHLVPFVDEDGAIDAGVVITIEGFNNKNTHYTLDGIEYNSLKKACEYWRANPYRYNGMIESDLRRVIHQPALIPYVRLVKGTGKDPVKTIALTNEAACAAYKAMGKKVPAPLLRQDNAGERIEQQA